VLHIDHNSIKFIKDTSSAEEGEIKKNWTTLIIPTQINIIQGYDFIQDTNKILSDIKATIAGKSIEEARTYILSTFPEVGSVKISVSPMWYTSIPTIKSRIKIRME
jgi:hypothetical protein